MCLYVFCLWTRHSELGQSIHFCLSVAQRLWMLRARGSEKGVSVERVHLSVSDVEEIAIWRFSFPVLQLAAGIRGGTHPNPSFSCGTHLHNLKHTVNTVSLKFYQYISHFPNHHQSTFDSILNKVKQDEKRMNCHACIHLYINS